MYAKLTKKTVEPVVKKSIPISQLNIYHRIKSENRAKIIHYSVKTIKDRLGLQFASSRVKEIDYSRPV